MPPRLRTAPAAGAVDVDAVARDGLAGLLAQPGVSRVGLALTEGGGRRLRFTASDRDPDRSVAWCHIDAYDDVPLTTVVRTGEVVCGSLADLEDRYEGLVRRQHTAGTRAIAAVPLADHGPPLGGLIVFYDRPQSFDDLQRAGLLASATTLAGRLRRSQTGEPRLRAADLPVGPDARVAALDVPADPRAVGESRRSLRRELTTWGVDDDAVDTVVLCLSELVTNAVVHTGAPSQVRAVLDAGVLTVSVADQGAAVAPDDSPADPADSPNSPHSPETDPLRVHGRGLQLVEALASRWGSELDEVGTTVWFVVEDALAG